MGFYKSQTVLVKVESGFESDNFKCENMIYLKSFSYFQLCSESYIYILLTHAILMAENISNTM